MWKRRGWGLRRNWEFRSDFFRAAAFRAAFRGLPEQTRRPQKHCCGNSPGRDRGARRGERVREKHAGAGTPPTVAIKGSEGSRRGHFSKRRSLAQKREPASGDARPANERCAAEPANFFESRPSRRNATERGLARTRKRNKRGVPVGHTHGPK